MDPSNGYEGIAAIFISVRGGTIGTAPVRAWARTLPPGCAVLDLGCGTGFPISQALVEEGLNVYGVDASPTLAAAFRRRFPDAPICCEPAEVSSFFHRKFDGIIAWGLLFLMAEEAQVRILAKCRDALDTGGKLLFTAPREKTGWRDVLTGRRSVSLGAARYRELLATHGFCAVEEFEDGDGNHYYSAVRA